jgi:hypothetical protein
MITSLIVSVLVMNENIVNNYTVILKVIGALIAASAYREQVLVKSWSR